MSVCPSVCHTCGQRGRRSGRATSVPRTLYVFNLIFHPNGQNVTIPSSHRLLRSLHKTRTCNPYAVTLSRKNLFHIPLPQNITNFFSEEYRHTGKTSLRPYPMKMKKCAIRFYRLNKNCPI